MAAKDLCPLRKLGVTFAALLISRQPFTSFPVAIAAPSVLRLVAQLIRNLFRSFLGQPRMSFLPLFPIAAPCLAPSCKFAVMQLTTLSPYGVGPKCIAKLLLETQSSRHARCERLYLTAALEHQETLEPLAVEYESSHPPAPSRESLLDFPLFRDTPNYPSRVPSARYLREAYVANIESRRAKNEFEVTRHVGRTICID